MPSPIDALRFVHTAICVEVRDIEQEAHEQSPDAATLVERIEFIARIIDLHTKGEEVGLFPALRERVPHVDDPYLFDHREEKELLDELREVARACADGGTEGDWQRLRRQTVALVEHVDAHVGKENGLILPLVAEHFAPPEQAEMVGKIVGTIGPQDMQAAMPWVVRCQAPDDAEAYVRGLMRAMPPQAFAAAKGWIEGGVPAERWNDLTARIPELAG